MFPGFWGLNISVKIMDNAGGSRTVYRKYLKKSNVDFLHHKKWVEYRDTL